MDIANLTQIFRKLTSKYETDYIVAHYENMSSFRKQCHIFRNEAEMENPHLKIT